MNSNESRVYIHCLSGLRIKVYRISRIEGVKNLKGEESTCVTGIDFITEAGQDAYVPKYCPPTKNAKDFPERLCIVCKGTAEIQEILLVE